MMRYRLICALVVWGLGALAAGAQQSVEKILPLDGRLSADGRVLELSWFDATPPRVGSVTVKRRLHGQTGGQTWVVLAEGLGPVMRFADDTIRPGVAYEYQVLRTARDVVDVGYWLAGTQVPAASGGGTAYMVTDETLAPALAAHLDRFERDLLGSGLRVLRRTVPRGDLSRPRQSLEQAAALREWLRARHAEDPFGRHMVILIGHVPFVLSGRANPDGHEPVPHASDLFYADMDGQWHVTVEGMAVDNQLPGDTIEMQVGRIDFRSVALDRQEREIRLLRAYFDKNHHWRHGLLGDLRGAYGQNDHLTVEVAALRNIVGPGALVTGGHHDVGEAGPWLWGVDFGDWNGSAYEGTYANEAVFAINFGSGKQKIEKPNNQMVALMAQPWYPVAVGWGGRPAWWLHHMALGGTIGDVHMRTVNNGTRTRPYRETMDYFPTGLYLWRNPVWVNLMGDPSLQAFPLSPPRDVRQRPVAEGVEITWTASPDPDASGYRVYRLGPEGGLATELTGREGTVQTRFTDPAPEAGTRYMVRAQGLKTVYAGSFHSLSQGAFSGLSPDTEPVFSREMSLEAASGAPVVLPAIFDAPAEGRIHAFVEGPAQGQLRYRWQEAAWIYTPPEGFSGTVPLRFSVSDRWRSDEGILTLRIGG